MIINNQELRSLIKDNLNTMIGKSMIITKSKYESMDINVIETKILPKYWNWLSIMRLTKWKDQWNCINFSEAFRVFSCAYYASLQESAAKSIPVGILQYYSERRPESETEGYHSINIAVAQENNINKVIFIEPQTCKIINLSPREIGSIKMLYI